MTATILDFVPRANGSRRKTPGEPGGRLIVGWFMSNLPARQPPTEPSPNRLPLPLPAPRSLLDYIPRRDRDEEYR